MSMTSSDICDIRDCAKKMLERIKIKISAPVPSKGKSINPGEHFTFTVEASNPWPIAFRNVKCEVKVVSPDPSLAIACLVAPASPAQTLASRGGNLLTPGQCYEKILVAYPEISPKSRILAESTTGIELEGIANEDIDDTIEGSIEAKVFADIDLPYLYAFGSPSSVGEVGVEIVT